MTNTPRASINVPSILAVIAIVTALAIFFGYGSADMSVPGPQNDEVADAVPALELLRGLPNTAFDAVTLFGIRLPLMMGHYIGPTSIYTSYVGMAIFGTTVAGLRFSQLVLGALTLVLLWFFARRWINALTASMAVLLCATAPVYLWWSRAGIHFAAPLLPLAIVFLMLLHSWQRKRQPAHLILAAFVFGLGLTAKLLFAWLLFPVGLCALLILGLRNSWSAFRAIRQGTLLASVVAFGLGFAPFIAHNLPAGASFRFIAENALQSRAYGHNNLDFIGNVQFELADFLRMMGGNTLHFDAPAGLPLSAIAVVFVLLYTLVICIRYRKAMALLQSETGASALPYLRLRLFLLITIATVIPLGTISISDIGARHLFIIMPLVWLLVAITISDIPIWLHARTLQTPRIALTAGIILLLTANHAVTNGLVQNYLEQSGGTALWSDALYQLAPKLESDYAGRPIIALDWGFERSVAFLTQGRVYIKEMHEYLPEPSPQFANVATVLLRDPANVYLFHTPEMTAFKGHFQVLERAAARAHKQLTLLDTLNERSGTPNTLIYQAIEKPRDFTVSPTLATRNAILAGGLTLLGGAVNFDPVGHEVAVKLQWQTTADQQPDDTVLLHIVDQSNGNVVLNGDQQPVYGSYPFPVWQKGEVVDDPHWLTLPADLKPGVYQVRVGVYDRVTGVRRDISDPQNDAAGNSLMLHSFVIK